MTSLLKSKVSANVDGSSLAKRNPPKSHGVMVNGLGIKP